MYPPTVDETTMYVPMYIYYSIYYTPTLDAECCTLLRTCRGSSASPALS